MRIVLVGRPAARRRLQLALATTSLDVVAEADAMPVASDEADVDAYLVAAHRDRPASPRLPEPLTPRELEVLTRLADGLSNKAIAARLGISDQTVKFHVAAVCGKLGVQNRTAAVRTAIRHGLLTI